MRCLYCGCENEDDALFCERCGKPIEKLQQGRSFFCPECGTENDADALFCEGCGMKFRDDAAVERTKGKKSKAPVIAAVILVLVIACVGGGAFFIHMKSESGRSDTAKEDVKEAEKKSAKSDAKDVEEKSEGKKPEEEDKENNENSKDNEEVREQAELQETREAAQEQPEAPAPVQVPAITMPNISSVSATSELAEANVVHSSSRIIDGDKNTAWVEGVNGQGYGQSVHFQFNGTYLVSGIRIRAGYQKNDDIYYKNSRPKEISVEFSDGTSEIIWLEDLGQAEQAVSFSRAVETDRVNLTIQSVYPGNKYEDTCISDIVFF